MKHHTHAFGDWAEQYSLEFLTQQGLSCIARQYQSRYGEIDLIMQGDLQLVFVEVKARAHTQYGQAHEVVSVSKQRKIMQTALMFLANYPQYEHYYARFDVICLNQKKIKATKPTAAFLPEDYQLQWIENAFTFAPELINLWG